MAEVGDRYDIPLPLLRSGADDRCGVQPPSPEDIRRESIRQRNGGDMSVVAPSSTDTTAGTTTASTTAASTTADVARGKRVSALM